jgi:fructokinase
MNESGKPAPVVACFGEILWDCLPRGIFLGGAPLNVAYHLGRLGLVPRMISAVGWDFLGDEAVRRMSAWGFDLSFVARRGNPTGTVRAALDDSGAARYTFDPSPAWDHISASLSLVHQTPPPAAFVFGTLALRESANRIILTTLLEAWPDSFRVVDMNLRPPFDGIEAVNLALSRASLLKLNDGELSALVGAGHGTPAGIAASARRLAQRHQLRRVCVTAGEKGAGLLWDEDWHWVDAHPVKVRDTVGAGDAFLAGLLAGLLAHRESPAEALTRACRLGEFVATQDGATPDYRCDASGKPMEITR